MINLQHHFHQLECSISHTTTLALNNKKLFQNLIANNNYKQKLLLVVI